MINLLPLLVTAAWTNAAPIDPTLLREAAQRAAETAATMRLASGDVRRSRSFGSITVSVDGALQDNASLQLHRVRIEEISTTEAPDWRQYEGRREPEPQMTLRHAYELDAQGRLLFVQDSTDLVQPKTEKVAQPQRDELGRQMIAKTIAAFGVGSWSELIEKNRRDGHRGYHSPAGETYALTSDNATVELSLGGRNCGGVSIRMSGAPSAEAGQEGEVWQLCVNDEGQPTGLDRSYARLDDKTVRNDHPDASDEQRAGRLLKFWLARTQPF